MAPEGANSPARRIYFAFQTAYIGTEEERAAGLALARELVAEFAEATTVPAMRDAVQEALAFAEAGDGYAALKAARRVMRHEEEVLGLPPLEPARASTRPAAE
jgi:flagellar protein FlbT